MKMVGSIVKSKSADCDDPADIPIGAISSGFVSEVRVQPVITHTFPASPNQTSETVRLSIEIPDPKITKDSLYPLQVFSAPHMKTAQKQPHRALSLKKSFLLQKHKSTKREEPKFVRNSALPSILRNNRHQGESKAREKGKSLRGDRDEFKTKKGQVGFNLLNSNTLQSVKQRPEDEVKQVKDQAVQTEKHKTDRDECEKKSSSISTFYCTEQTERATFDLMEVQVTMYSMSGIVCQVDVCDEYRVRRSFGPVSLKARNGVPREIKRKSAKNKTQGQCSSSTEASTHSSSSQASQEADKAPFKGPPTTAVVSCRRNVLSSDTSIETFLPSLPLQATLTNELGDNIRYTAAWPSYANSDDIDSSRVCSQSGLSTLKVLRVMRREPYRRGCALIDMSTYAHETIEIQLFVGRGREMLPIGVATLAVSGEEEGEVLVNIPIKPQALPPKGKTLSLTRKKRVKKLSFLSEPDREYKLEDHATMRVGVRVLPYQAVVDSSQKRSSAKIQDDRDLEKILAGVFQENLVIELSPDASALRQFQGKQRGGNGPNLLGVETMFADEAEVADNNGRMDQQTPTITEFLCGAIEMLATSDDEHGGLTPARTVNFLRNGQKFRSKAKKTSTALVLPMSLLSSISDSVSSDSTPNNEEPEENVGRH